MLAKPACRFAGKRLLIAAAAILITTTGRGEDHAAPSAAAFAAARVSPGDVPLSDTRSQPLKDLNGYFPFVPPTTREAWESRADQLRRRIRVAAGIWPEPERTPLNPTIHGKVARDGFTVEKVFFESVPGHYVTGFLFRPEKVAGQVPGVLCPHGHGGRLQKLDTKTVRRMIAAGQERFEASGSYPKLARCAQLARMGCVTFMFDMLGYGDSQQISYEVAHRYGKPRPQYAGGKTVDGGWGFYTIQAESRLQSIMGLQTWNAIRALDFLEQLPDVDPQRLAVTGNSGGGTQTIILGAIDTRPIVSFPNGMVSVSMQGGCTCENCSLLRVGTGNVELAALMAPRPQAMTAADDWTIKMMTDGYPQLQQIYRLYDRGDAVLCRDFTHFPHNFNYVTRAMMYEWFNKYLNLGLETPIVEEDWKPFSDEEAAIWNEDHPAPDGGDPHEREVTNFLTQQAQGQLQELLNEDTKSLQPYRDVVGAAWETIIGRTPPRPEQVEYAVVEKRQQDDITITRSFARLPGRGEAVPMLALTKRLEKPAQKTVIWLDAHGKAALFNDAGQLHATAVKSLDDGADIIAPDLFGQGEWTADGKPIDQQRVVKNPRQYAGYTFTYNPTLWTRRVHDVMTLITLTETGRWKDASTTLVAGDGTESIAAAAAAMAGSSLEKLQLHDVDFRFADLKSYRDPDFVPGGAKYGDLPGLLALAAPVEIEVEAGSLPPLVKRAHNIAAQPETSDTP